MGLFSGGSSKSGSAQKWAKPYAKAGASAVMDVYNQNAGNLANISGQVSGMLPDLLAKFNEGNAGIDAAGGYITDVLGGKYLEGNPYLDAMVGSMQDNVTDRVGAAYGSRGSFGGTAWTTALGKALSEAELGLRYGNYSDEMSRMAGAAGLAPSIAQGEYTGLQEILGTAGLGAELPYTGINAMSGSLASLFSGGKQKGPGFGSQLLGAGASALGSYLGAGGTFSDRRLKTNIKLLRRDDDGLGWYEFAYKANPGRMLEGVMADEVKELRPDAYVPNYRGTEYDGVDYAKL